MKDEYTTTISKCYATDCWNYSKNWENGCNLTDTVIGKEGSCRKYKKKGG